MTDVKAAVIRGMNAPFTIERLTIDDPRAGEIMVDIKAVGICHTDLIMTSSAVGIELPAVLGHEGAGVVAAVGEGVTKVVPGDKVLLTFNSCGQCRRCKIDDPSYCEHFGLMNLACIREDGSSRLHKNGEKISDNFFGQSSFASKAITNERNIVKLHPDDDLVKLAPLGCGIQTGVGAVTRSLKAKAGDSLVIIGAGSVGLSALLGGALAECSPIILIEPNETRRTLASNLGADYTIDPGLDDVVQSVRNLLPAGADHVVDTSGYIPAMSSAINMLSPKGKLGLVGIPSEQGGVVPVPVAQWIMLGGTVRGIIEGDSDPDVFLPELIEYYKNGDLPFDKFVTVYPFEDINKAVEDSHKGDVIKVVLTL